MLDNEMGNINVTHYNIQLLEIEMGIQCQLAGGFQEGLGLGQ